MHDDDSCDEGVNAHIQIVRLQYTYSGGADVVRCDGDYGDGDYGG